MAAYLYYLLAIVFILFIPINSRNKVYPQKLDPFFFLFFVFFLSLLSFRSEGVDLDNYVYSFYQNPSDVPDFGYRSLIYIFNALNLSLAHMFLAMNLITIYAFHRFCNKNSINFALFITFYFLHLMVLRDLVQLRSAFAFSLFLLSITYDKKYLKFIIGLIASSIHLTVIPLILSFYFFTWIFSYKLINKSILISLSFLVIILVGSNLEYLNAIDPRIGIYLNWKKEGYGNEVSNLSFLYFHTVILLISSFYYFQSKSNDKLIEILLLLEVISLVTFVSLSDIAIFAFRISSMIASLYPFLLIRSLQLYENKVGDISISKSLFILVPIACFLLFRPGTFELILSLSLPY